MSGNWEQRVRQLHQQNLQMNEMLQQLLTTFHPSDAPLPPRSATATTNLVTPPAAIIRHESPPQTTEIVAPVTSPPPLQQQQPVAAADVLLSEELPVVPIFFIVDNTALPATFSTLLDEYQRHGLWRYKKIKVDWTKRHWNSNDYQKFALHQRQYLYNQIEREEAQAMEGRSRNERKKMTWPARLAAAAVALDQKYKNQSLEQAMKAMQAADHTVKSRRRSAAVPRGNGE
jgi:hypothetical protein